MVMRNITTNKNCGNSNKLLHRFRNLVAIHSLHIAMVVRNVTTNKNCGNSNKLLHRLRNLVAIHGLPIAMVVRNITTQQLCGNNFKQQQQCSFWLQQHQTVATPISTNATKCHHGNIINQQQHFSKKGCYSPHLLQRRT